MRINTNTAAKRTQRGAALVTAMIFLVILLLAGLSVVTTTTSEEKMARNFRDYDIAYAAAEAALRDAELHVSGAWRWWPKPVDTLAFDGDCTNGLCDSTYSQPSTPIDKLDFYSGAAPGSNSVVIGTVTSSPNIAGVPTNNQPRYMIEKMCALDESWSGPCKEVFRITAQGRGRLPNTRVVLQELYISPYKNN